MEFPRALFWALCTSLYIFQLSAKLCGVMEYISTAMWPTLGRMCPKKLMINLKIMKLETCLYVLKKWISENFLLLNSDKTEMLVIAPAQQVHHFDQVTITLDNCYLSRFNCQDTLSFDQHIKEITKITIYHLHNIAKIRSFLSTVDTEILIHAFVLSEWIIVLAYFRLFCVRALKVFRWFRMLQLAS